ncbi:MAG: acyl carrier protein [Bacteroidota bacterium]
MLTTTTTLDALQEIFVDVLDEEDIVLTATTTADDIEEWDSLAHVQLIVAIERAFGIKFTATEIEAFTSVGDMVNTIEQKQA